MDIEAAYQTAFSEVVLKMSTSALAEALGEKIQTVSNWRSRGIPANRCKEVAALTGISVKRLRPHDWSAYWPDTKAAA